jgi:DNA polymerase-3 subunit epsilon
MIHPPAQPLDRLPFIFLDVETTGLAPQQGHRVCELAMLQVTGEQVDQEFESLIDPQRPLDPRAAAVHGISLEMLRGAPTFAAVADQVATMIEGSVLVAHNAPFDMAFLEHEFRLAHLPPPTTTVIDTLRLARRLLRRSSYSLGALSRDLHLELPAHRAMADVVALRGLFRYLLQRLAAMDIVTLDELLRFQRGLLPGQDEPAAPPLIARALHEGRPLRIIYRSRSSGGPIARVVQPRELMYEQRGMYLLAYCYLRNDQRTFAVRHIESMELLEGDAPEHS